MLEYHKVYQLCKTVCLIAFVCCMIAFVSSQYDKSVVAFGEDPKTVTSDEFFGIFNTFLISFAVSTDSWIWGGVLYLTSKIMHDLGYGLGSSRLRCIVFKFQEAKNENEKRKKKKLEEEKRAREQAQVSFHRLRILNQDINAGL